MLPALIASITIKRPIYGAGGSFSIASYTTLYQCVPAFVCPASAATVTYYQQQDIEVTHSIYTDQFPISVKAGDQIFYGSRVFTLKGYRNEGEMDIISTIDCFEVLTQEP